MKVLVTGCAGFIGFHVACRLLERGDHVVGVDNVNDYYDTGLKEARLNELAKIAIESPDKYEFIRGDLADQKFVNAFFNAHRFDRVIHMAAQAGVRYSLENPHSYVQSNLVAFTNILEACRYTSIQHLTYASTSSVYGANTRMPFSEHQCTSHPLQFYAATKKANEMMAHSYSHLFNLPTTGLRFFTVYGPWGRPDMALFDFTKKILAGEKIPVFNYGNHSRDFTYIDDIVEGVLRVSDHIATPNDEWQSESPDPASSNAPYRIYNIGNNSPVKLSAYIEAIESSLGTTARKDLLPLQPGDVPDTYADSTELEIAVGYKPKTSISVGVGRFVEWYKNYYHGDS